MDMDTRKFAVCAAHCLILFASTFLATRAAAMDRTFNMAWDAVPAAVSYCLHHGTRSRAYADKKCTPDGQTSLSWTLEITTGKDYFAVTAVGSNGAESNFSNEVLVNTVIASDGTDSPQGPGEETAGIGALIAIIYLLLIDE